MCVRQFAFYKGMNSVLENLSFHNQNTFMFTNIMIIMAGQYEDHSLRRQQRVHLKKALLEATAPCSDDQRHRARQAPDYITLQPSTWTRDKYNFEFHRNSNCTGYRNIFLMHAKAPG